MVQRLAESPIYLRIDAPMEVKGRSKAGSREGGKVTKMEHESLFTIYAYKSRITGEEHIAIVKDIKNGVNVPLRVQSSCVTAEVFHASSCDCREQLEMSLALIDQKGFGMVIWLHQEGKGNGLAAKIKQLNIMLTDGLDTVAAFEKAGYPKDLRDYSAAADILRDLKVRSVKLITNNPDKQKQLKNLGIKVTGRIPCEVEPENELVRKNLMAKRDKLGHLIKHL